MKRAGFFGKIALEKGIVREPDILKALEMQLEYERQDLRVPRLGEALVAMGAMTADQVREVLRYQNSMSGELPDIPSIASAEASSSEEAKPSADTVSIEEDCGLKVGDTFANYKLISKLGSGQMGSAWKVKHENGGKPVLLRVFTREAMDVPWAGDFDRQVIRATKLEHSGIQRILRGGLYEGKHYYISDLDQGKSLSSLLEERGSLELATVTELAVHLCAALQYAHGREMYHNHISPTSILIGSGFEVKLTAYGMVPDPIGSLNRMAEEVGDIPFYTAPELVIAEGDTSICNSWSDFYSVGAVLFHCLTGVPAFHGLSTEEILPQMYDNDKIKEMLEDAEIDPDMSRIVVSLMDCDPQQRIKTSGELMVALSPLRDKYKFSAAGWNTPSKRGKFIPGHKGRKVAEEISRPKSMSELRSAKGRPTRLSSGSKPGSKRSKTSSGSRRSRRGRRTESAGESRSSSGSSTLGLGSSSSSRTSSGSGRRSERLSARKSAREKRASEKSSGEPLSTEKKVLVGIAASAAILLVGLFSYTIYMNITQGKGALDVWFNYDKKLKSVARQIEQEKENIRKEKLRKEFEEKRKIAEAKRQEELKKQEAEQARILAEQKKQAEEERIRKVAAQLLAEQQNAAGTAENADGKKKDVAEGDQKVAEDTEKEDDRAFIPRRGGGFLSDPDAN